MTPHQLTHVLIKAIAASLIIYALPNLVLGVISAAGQLFAGTTPPAGLLALTGGCAVDAGIAICIGALIIRRSKRIASWLTPDSESKG